jgi:hypothetical protein
MRTMLAALALAVAFALPATSTPPTRTETAKPPQTLYASPKGPIDAFAQDGALLAWFAPSARGCNSVRVLSLTNGGQVELPKQTPTTPNVTCRWTVVPPIRLVLARSGLSSSPYALWTLYEKIAPLEFDSVLGAGVRDPRERRFREVAHSSQGVGLWLGGIAADAGTIVYAVSSVQYVDEVACLAHGSCEKKVVGGGIHRISGRSDSAIPNTPPAVAVAVFGDTLADVPASPSVGKDGAPLASAELPVEIRDARTGTLLAHATPQGTPVAVALSAGVLATLELTPKGPRVAWYDPTTGALGGSVAVAAGAARDLSVSGHTIVFRVGRTIRDLNVTTQRIRTLARAASTPIGLSIEGNRVAWAENVDGRGRIRAIYVAASGAAVTR